MRTVGRPAVHTFSMPVSGAPPHLMPMIWSTRAAKTKKLGVWATEVEAQLNHLPWRLTAIWPWLILMPLTSLQGGWGARDAVHPAR